ncbi:MAG TPA: tetratricopeptide repeat protein, partial [Gemmatimonadaceae bacterium]
MSGSAMFSGATYQARTAAYVYVHILAQKPLGWLGPLVNDTPSFVSAETAGPGDDLGITFAGSERPAELQAKHGLTGAKLKETLLGIHSRSKPGDSSRVILPVNRVGAQRLLKEFAPDSDRLRAGRGDALHASTRALLNDLGLGGDGERLLRRIYLVPFDIDNAGDPEAKLILELLATRLKDSGQAAAAWNAFISDAGDIAARRLARDRADLVRLLEAARIGVRPSERDEPWLAELDFIKGLLDRQADAVALGSLDRLGSAIAHGTANNVDPEIQSRLARYEAISLLRLERTSEAMAKAKRALDFSPSNVPALTVASATALLSGRVSEARSLAERAVESDPQSPHAWIALVRAQMAQGDAFPMVPVAVTRTTHYRSQLAHIAAENGAAAEVLERTAELLAEGVRTEEVLLLRANALLAPTIALEDRTDSRFEEVDRLATEVLDRIDEFHPQAVRALVLRGNARERMGRAVEADEDLARARRLRADDPDAILHTARMRLMSGDSEGA